MQHSWDLILNTGHRYNRANVNRLCDPDGIKQVLLNLMVNSLDAVPDTTGTISIVAEGTEHGVWISVCDNGPGMPEDIRKHALEPFFTDKPKGLVRACYSQHNHARPQRPGNHSAPDLPGPLDGTCVMLFSRHRVMKDQNNECHRKNVLIVDDEPSLRLLIRAVLESDGWNVHEAQSGEQALEMLPGLTLNAA